MSLVTAILVHSAGTVYLSNQPYVSGTGDSPANTPFRDVIKVDPVVTQSIEGSAVGTLKIINDGTMDTWGDLLWVGFSVDIYLDGVILASVLNGGVRRVTQEGMTFDLLDKKTTLDIPLQDTFLSDGNPVPILLGSVWNAQCINTTGNTYQVHESTVQIVSCKDDALDVNTNPNSVSESGDDWAFGTTGTGTFLTDSAPAGTISGWFQQLDVTADAQLRYVLSKHSIAYNVADLGQLPTDVFLGNQWTAAGTTLRQAVDDICRAIDAYWYINADGEFTANVLDPPSATQDQTISADQVKSLSRINLTNAASPMTINYSKNFSILTNPSSLSLSKQDYLNEWRNIVTSVNPNAADYPNGEDRIFNMNLAASWTDSGGTTTNTNIAALTVEMDLKYHQPRARWKAVVFTDVALGSVVEITAPIIGWETGQDARVVSVKAKASELKRTIEVWL